MARYADKYFKAKDDLKKALDDLAKVRADNDLYRNFLMEGGHVGEFMIWFAKQQGFSGETIQRVADAAAEMKKAKSEAQ